MQVILRILMLTILVGCNSAIESRPITLYKGTVAAGNGVVHFISHNDPDGINSMKHCEALKAFYESAENSPYVCASVVFDKFAPRADWNIAN